MFQINIFAVAYLTSNNCDAIAKLLYTVMHSLHTLLRQCTITTPLLRLGTAVCSWCCRIVETSSLSEFATFSHHNDSVRLRFAERWRDKEVESGVEMADGSQNIRDKKAVSRLVCASVCVCVCVWYRKEAQPAAAVCPSNQITGRKGESERDRESERAL